MSSGEVALMKDLSDPLFVVVFYQTHDPYSSTPKKPKSRKPPVNESGPVKEEDGTKEHPISLLSDDKLGKKRKNYTIIEENGKKRKVVDLVCLSTNSTHTLSDYCL